eukprot:1296562-Pyramimonas_sp.AAC.1
MVTIAAYFPVCPWVAKVVKEMLTYKKTVKQMLDWMDQICRFQPTWCPTVFGGDINDDAGVPDEQNPARLWRPQREHHCMTLPREFMENYSLCLANTCLGGHDTFHGRASSPGIDYLG